MPPSTPAAVNRIGNAWHIPRNVEPPLGGSGTMRDPATGSAPESPVAIFSGNQFQGPGEAGNQLETGSTVFFRKVGDAAWTALAMRFRTTGGNNKYYVAVLSTKGFSVNDKIQYYLKILYSDHLTTFLHGNDDQSFATAKESEAQADPFAFIVAPQTASAILGFGAVRRPTGAR
jgi:hypothetical protein